LVTFKGFNTGLLYAAETSYASGGTPTTPVEGKVSTFTFNITNNFIRTQGLGEGRNVTKHLFGNLDVTGTLDWEMGDPTILQYCVGPKSGTGSNSSDPFVLTEADAVGYTTDDIKSFQLKCSSDESTDYVRTFTGCLINSVTLSSSIGETLKASADVVGKTCTISSAATTYTQSSVVPWVMQQGAFKFGPTPSSVAKVNNFTFTFANSLFIYRSAGSRFIEQPEPGLRKYDFTATLRVDQSHFAGSDGLLQQMLGGTSPATGVSSAEPTSNNEMFMEFAEGVASDSRTMRVQLDSCAIDSWNEPIDLGGGIIEVTVNGVAMAGKGNTPLVWYG